MRVMDAVKETIADVSSVSPPSERMVKQVKRRSWTPRKDAFLPCGHLDLSQRLLNKMTNPRAVLIARIHACKMSKRSQ